MRPRATTPAWVVLSIWAVVAGGLAIAGLGVDGRLSPVSLTVPGTPSARAEAMLEERFGDSVPVTVLLEGPARELDRQGPRLVAAFRRRDGMQVLSPWEGARELATLRPRPGAALVVANFPDGDAKALTHVLPATERIVAETVRSPVRSHVSGVAAISRAIQESSLEATHRAELIALPVLLLVLLLVFRSPVAAAIPLLMGATTVLAGRGLLTIATFFTPINSLGVAIASMMGLALGVDYALLMVSRVRQERDAGAELEEAIATAARVAGRTIVCAGGTLAVAMVAATVVASGSLLASVAIGVVISGLLSVLLAISLMPAALRAVGPNLERWRLPSPRRRGRALAASSRLIARPAVSVPLILVAMAAIGAPATAMSIGAPDVRQLPESSEARQSFEAVERAISPGWTAPYVVVATARDGVVAQPERLRALARWQDRIARSPGVETVIGPAALRRGEGALSRTQREYAHAGRRLADAGDGIAKLRDGLADADAGLAELRDGLATAANGAESLAAGAGRARAGARRLRDGLARASAGSRRLARGMDRAVRGADRLARGNRRLRRGADQLADGIDRLDAGLAAALEPARLLAEQLAAWSDLLDRLEQPTDEAVARLEDALRQLDALGAYGDDPRVAEIRASLVAAYGAIVGALPPGTAPAQLPPIPDGAGAAPSLEALAGLVPLLGEARGQLADAAERLAALPRSLDLLSDGVRRLRRGARRLARGARASERGTLRLRAGLRRLAAGAHALDRGLARMAGGGDELDRGLASLAAGAGKLSAGLRDGHERSGALRDGLRAARGPLADHATVLRGYERGYRALERRSPGAIDSGYLILTALDGTVPAVRDQIAQIVNVDGGGQAVRMLVVPDAGPNTPATARVGQRLHETLPALARASETDVAVGEGAQSLADYAAATNRRLPLLILALSIVATLTLILVVRSVVLPPIAVALNLLTIAAAFGGLELLFRLGVFDGPRYVDAISAAGILAIMFVLSIDYEVFLLTRMREAWLATGDAAEAVAIGLRHTAGVITGAAAIMSAVFLAFAGADVASLQQFGAGLTIAVVLDATVIRLVLLPAIMRGLGRHAWWMPRWLDERLPDVEGTGVMRRGGLATAPAGN